MPDGLDRNISDGIDPAIRGEILSRLSSIESAQDVKILYACESGSRAWGFASPDSDYDVRFVYVHKRDWYLSFDVERQRDVIECSIEDDIDCSGWDLRKALQLFARTNGALLEWLNSPIRYLERGDAAGSLRGVLDSAVEAARVMMGEVLQYILIIYCDGRVLWHSSGRRKGPKGPDSGR